MYKKATWRVAIIFIIFWVFAAIVFIGYSPFRISESEYETITNSEFDFSVEYPTKWHARTYGENGFKGEHAIRLRIYQSTTGFFEIAVRQKPAHNPTLDDVNMWGFERIEDINNDLSLRGDPLISEIFLQEESFNNNIRARRRYTGGGITNEDVYIARANDMISITLQATDESFENYLDEYNKIVDSFEPVD